MHIFKHNEWVNISSKKKIIYYPEFYYGALNVNNHRVFDSYFIEDQMRTHLFRMNILLLYFHHISMPFVNFYVNFNSVHSYLYNKLFKNGNFRELIAKGLIIYELRSKYDPLSYYSRYENELGKSEILNASPINNDLRSIFHDLLVVERGEAHLDRSYGMKEAIENTLSKSFFLENDMELIKKTIDKCSYGGNAFMHEIFVYELKNCQYKLLHNALANDYLRISETSNYNTLTYTPINNLHFGNLLRENISNNVYAFLYSPDFFEFFLSLFIDINKDINIYNLSLKKTMEIRSYDFWDDFVYEYHDVIEQVSRQLHSSNKDKILNEAKKAMIIELDAGKMRKVSALLLKFILTGIITASRLPVSSQFIDEAHNLSKSSFYLRLNKKYKAIKYFLRLLLSLMKHR